MYLVLAVLALENVLPVVERLAKALNLFSQQLVFALKRGRRGRDSMRTAAERGTATAGRGAAGRPSYLQRARVRLLLLKLVVDLIELALHRLARCPALVSQTLQLPVALEWGIGRRKS